MPDPVLCYVDGEWAYFTTQPLEKQTGDDWDDVPYEHNAGTPYRPETGEKFQIIKVAWEGPFETPADNNRPNSPYSVDEINAVVVPWLGSKNWSSDGEFIWAGTTLTTFCNCIERAGGKVYFPRQYVPSA